MNILDTSSGSKSQIVKLYGRDAINSPLAITSGEVSTSTAGMLRDCALKEESRAVHHIVHGCAVGNKVKSKQLIMGCLPLILEVQMDYSDIELILLAEQVPRLDIHKVTASEMFRVPYSEVTPEQRKAAKALNFFRTYGVPDGLR